MVDPVYGGGEPYYTDRPTGYGQQQSRNQPDYVSYERGQQATQSMPQYHGGESRRYEPFYGNQRYTYGEGNRYYSESRPYYYGGGQQEQYGRAPAGRGSGGYSYRYGPQEQQQQQQQPLWYREELRPASAFRGTLDKTVGSVQSGVGKLFQSDEMIQRGMTRKIAGETQRAIATGAPLPTDASLVSRAVREEPSSVSAKGSTRTPGFLEPRAVPEVASGSSALEGSPAVQKSATTTVTRPERSLQRTGVDMAAYEGPAPRQSALLEDDSGPAIESFIHEEITFSR